MWRQKPPYLQVSSDIDWNGVEGKACHTADKIRSEIIKQSSTRADTIKASLLHYKLTGDRAGDTAVLLGGYSRRFVPISLESSRESRRAVQS